MTTQPAHNEPQRLEPTAGTPYYDENESRWWVVVDTPWEALRVVHQHDENREYFGVTYTVERCCIRGATPGSDIYAEFGGAAVEECQYTTDEGAVEAFRVDVADG